MTLPVQPDLQPARARDEEDLHLAVLVRAIEHEIIPRLMLAHRESGACLPLPELTGASVSTDEVEQFVRLVLEPDESLAQACVQVMRTRGTSIETICLQLFAPVARRLGELWEQDLCDFNDVTLGLGRLHQLLRELSPAFDQRADSPANGRRILLLPAPGEQHTFGLVMVGEFFRRAGWEVETPLDATPPEEIVRTEWFDTVGFSLSADQNLAQLAAVIRRIRQASVNRRLCIMVGGALFARQPEQVAAVGADAAASSAGDAPALAEKLAGVEWWRSHPDPNRPIQ